MTSPDIWKTFLFYLYVEYDTRWNINNNDINK